MVGEGSHPPTLAAGTPSSTVRARHQAALGRVHAPSPRFESVAQSLPASWMGQGTKLRVRCCCNNTIEQRL